MPLTGEVGRTGGREDRRTGGQGAGGQEGGPGHPGGYVSFFGKNFYLLVGKLERVAKVMSIPERIGEKGIFLSHAKTCIGH
jgi:hypothetical protein